MPRRRKPSRLTISIAGATLVAAAAAASIPARWPVPAPARLTAATTAGPARPGHVLSGTVAQDIALVLTHRTTSQPAGPSNGVTTDAPSGQLATPLVVVLPQHGQLLAVKTAYLISRETGQFPVIKPPPPVRRPVTVLAAKPKPAPAQATAAPQAAVAPPAASGSPQEIAEAMLASFGWSSSQFSCLNDLWEEESGWNVYAANPASGAYGIPQALPGSKMASAGPDWQSDATTQITWGLDYIQSTYGSPCAAWEHEQADGWY